ncbi:hypothetical protein BT96DRAFT_679723 [Gymnopus androsaceus JB14]|uniref:Uncharacterized protein n=1 Tax=Gymnopus androsaceus JB14 TaxID=1447944 RepID=A0A6A4HS83_9AGAR|nr:hypothetical protein BT96DRAFT_679723 [Gymnopus androsaceus JB14]
MSGIHSAVLTFGLSGTSYQLGRKSKDLELLKSIGEHTGSLRVRNSQLPHEAVALAFVAHLVLFQHALVSPTHIAPAGRIARARAFKRFFFFAGLLNALILVQYVDLVSPGQLVTGS